MVIRTRLCGSTSKRKPNSVSLSGVEDCSMLVASGTLRLRARLKLCGFLPVRQAGAQRDENWVAHPFFHLL
jgi:hypothetical protein